MTHRHAIQTAILVLLLTLSALPGFAQAGAGREQSESGHGRGSGQRGGLSGGQQGGQEAKPKGGGDAAVTTASPVPAHMSSFPSRLGETVGARAVPLVGMAPGTRNINNPGGVPGVPTLPGMQPLPMTPQPSPADPFGNRRGHYPNINDPAGVNPRSLPGRDHDRDARGGYGDRRGPAPRGNAPVYYLLPYYIPYEVTTANSSLPEPTPEPTVARPDQPGGIAAQPLRPMPQPGPYGSVSSSTGASSTAATGPLLAFKDRTLVLVKAYWLEGETIWYETEGGSRTPISISQLDFELTQQLNRERNVKFVLESR